MKNVFLVFLLFVGIATASAQDVYTSSGKPGYQKNTRKAKKGYDPEKLIIGGGIAAGFGSGFVNAGISPVVGYRFTKRFSAGIGLGYQYYQEPEYTDPVDPNKVSYIKENIVFPNLWARYFVWRNLFVDATFEYDFIYQSYPGYDNMGNYTTIKLNVTNPCLLLGAGFRIPIAGRVSVLAELIYDVLQGQYSPYPVGSPDLRVGIVAGL